MSQTKKDEPGTESIKTVAKKNSMGNLKSARSSRSRSMLDDDEEEEDYESDEEISFTMDDTELKVSTSAAPKSVVEVFTCLAYCTENQTLCAGTSQGNLYIWKRNIQGILSGMENGVTNGYDSMENFWHLVNVANVRGAIKYCCWGVCDVATPCVLVNCISNVYILKVKNNNNSKSKSVGQINNNSIS